MQGRGMRRNEWGAGGSPPCRGLGQRPKLLCRSTKRERFEWPKAARNAGRFHIDGVRGMPGAQRARRRKPPGRGRRDRGGGVRAAGRTGMS